jgi:hypothetical protein
MKRIWLGVIAIGLGACTAESRSVDQKTQSSSSALTREPTTQRLTWGDAQGQLGFRPAIREAMPMGVPAIAVAPNGSLLVLDALHERVIRTQKGDVVELAKVPADCDDIAIAADGAFAVRRSVKPEVLVFGPQGEKIGSVYTSAVLDADAITLGTSRRVFVTNGFQQTFLVGSPSMPQTKAFVQAGVREGAALLADGSGVVAAKNGDEVELRVIAQTGQTDRSEVRAHWTLGKAEAGRVVGVSGNTACARIEHVTTDASGAIAVKREAACLDLATGKTLFRKELPAPGAYMPRRELSMSGPNLVFARASADGLDVTSFVIEGGVR